MPRIAKFRTYFRKRILGDNDPRPHFQYNFFFLSFLWPPPLFSASSYATDIYKYLTYLNDTHFITLFEFISVPYEYQHQSLYIKNYRGQIRLREYLFRHTIKLLYFQGGNFPCQSSWGGDFVHFQFASYVHHIGRFMTIKRLIKPLFIFNQQ